MYIWGKGGGGDVWARVRVRQNEPKFQIFRNNRVEMALTRDMVNSVAGNGTIVVQSWWPNPNPAPFWAQNGQKSQFFRNNSLGMPQSGVYFFILSGLYKFVDNTRLIQVYINSSILREFFKTNIIYCFVVIAYHAFKYYTKGYLDYKRPQFV